MPRALPLAAALIAAVAIASPASAAKKRTVAKPDADKYAAIVVDANNGKTLFARNADAHRYPASLTKMLTLYVLFEELDAGRLTLDSKLTVSEYAASQAPSKLGVRPGSTIKVEDAILSLTTKSANDVAVVIAENVGGSVTGFAARMNRSARKLGMNSSTFRNPNGLPDPGQKTTARDLARLGQGLQTDFPQYYKFFGVQSFTYKGVKIRNHNRLVGSVEGVDGIKTGYTRASGFNLVTNLRRDGRHVVGVVMGGRTASSRDAEMRRLLTEYLPEASRGAKTAPVVVAENVRAEAGMREEAGDVETPAIVDARQPRPRPDRAAESDTALAYAAAERPRDVLAALAQSEVVAESEEMEGDRSDPEDETIADAVEARIAAATEVAELAYAAPPSQNAVMQRLREMAQLRAGHTDMVARRPLLAGAAARVETATGEADKGSMDWTIQVGAVPTAEGAQALLEKAKDTSGDVLAKRRAVTQEIQKGGTTIYRARFAGFEDKDAARAACAKLKSRSISCLAVPG